MMKKMILLFGMLMPALVMCAEGENGDRGFEENQKLGALFCAAQTEDFPTLLRLIDAKADLNVTRFGVPLLAHVQSAEVAKLLLDHKATATAECVNPENLLRDSRLVLVFHAAGISASHQFNRGLYGNNIMSYLVKPQNISICKSAKEIIRYLLRLGVPKEEFVDKGLGAVPNDRRIEEVFRAADKLSEAEWQAERKQLLALELVALPTRGAGNEGKEDGAKG